jgi:flavodoxin I
VYGTTYGHTADAAERIASRLDSELGEAPAVFDVAAVDARSLETFGTLLLGSSTWHWGELQADWEARVDDLDDAWRGRRVGLFGAGDREGYPETYGDALGILAERVEARGATLIGTVPIEPGNAPGARARRGDRAVGLLLDFVNDPDEVDDRITAWCTSLAPLLAAGSPLCAG